MAKEIPKNQRLVASVLDRLIVFGPNESVSQQDPTALSLGELQDNVFRDLQQMLNSRQSLVDPLPDDAELHRSVLAFGLPDISNVNPDNLDQQANIRSAVEAAIRAFEPRLSNVEVVTSGASASDRSLRLTVKAHLKVDPSPVPVVFDTVIESGTGEWKVKPS